MENRQRGIVMIVNDADTHVEMIPQHEHARISAALFEKWGDASVYQDVLWNELLVAVREHDRAWIPLDASPLLDKFGKPYSFIDYPEGPKIKAYQHGIESVAEKHIYSGLLVSRHYASFFESSQTESGRRFLQSERQRQQRWRKRQQRWRKKLNDPQTEEFHLKVLQFCDDASLYVCMNKPGAAKHEEISWFKDGFRQQFSFLNNRKIHAHFYTSDTIKMDPFPLLTNLEITINGIVVDKQQIVKKGIKKAYFDGRPCLRNFRFVPSLEVDSKE